MEKQKTDLLLCKDCKHSRWRPWHALSHRCYRVRIPAVTKIDVVTGPITTPAHYESCFSQRFDGDDNCGKAGRYWQPKHKKDLFKLIKKEVY